MGEALLTSWVRFGLRDELFRDVTNKVLDIELLLQCTRAFVVAQEKLAKGSVPQIPPNGGDSGPKAPKPASCDMWLGLKS